MNHSIPFHQVHQANPELIHELFDEELDRLLRESANGGDEPAAAMLREARRISEEMIRKSEFDPA